MISLDLIGLDSWLNLTRVDPDEEVQGEIHLSLELLKDTEKICLRCQVIEARYKHNCKENVRNLSSMMDCRSGIRRRGSMLVIEICVSDGVGVSLRMLLPPHILSYYIHVGH